MAGENPTVSRRCPFQDSNTYSTWWTRLPSHWCSTPLTRLKNPANMVIRWCLNPLSLLNSSVYRVSPFLHLPYWQTPPVPGLAAKSWHLHSLLQHKFAADLRDDLWLLVSTVGTPFFEMYNNLLCFRMEKRIVHHQSLRVQFF